MYFFLNKYKVFLTAKLTLHVVGKHQCQCELQNLSPRADSHCKRTKAIWSDLQNIKQSRGIIPLFHVAFKWIFGWRFYEPL